MSRFLRFAQGGRNVSQTVTKQGAVFKAVSLRGLAATREYLLRKWGLRKDSKPEVWFACRRMTNASLCRAGIPYRTPFTPFGRVDDDGASSGSGATAATRSLAYWALEPARRRWIISGTESGFNDLAAAVAMDKAKKNSDASLGLGFTAIGDPLSATLGEDGGVSERDHL